MPMLNAEVKFSTQHRHFYSVIQHSDLASEMSSPGSFQSRHIGPTTPTAPRCSRRSASITRRPHRSDHSARPSGSQAPLDSAGRRSRAHLPPPAARHRRAQHRRPFVHRHGLLRMRDAERNPAQRLRESGLVHAVYAVSGRDCAGPPRIAAQFPDGRSRPDRRWTSRRRRSSTRARPRPKRWRCSIGCRRRRSAAGESCSSSPTACYPQTLDVLRGRAEPLDVEVEVGDPRRVSDERLRQRFRAPAAVSGRARRGGRSSAD